MFTWLEQSVFNPNIPVTLEPLKKVEPQLFRELLKPERLFTCPHMHQSIVARFHSMTHIHQC